MVPKLLSTDMYAPGTRVGAAMTAALRALPPADLLTDLVGPRLGVGRHAILLA